MSSGFVNTRSSAERYTAKHEDQGKHRTDRAHIMGLLSERALPGAGASLSHPERREPEQDRSLSSEGAGSQSRCAGLMSSCSTGNIPRTVHRVKDKGKQADHKSEGLDKQTPGAGLQSGSLLRMGRSIWGYPRLSEFEGIKKEHARPKACSFPRLT